jgi:hypothetical protein
METNHDMNASSEADRNLGETSAYSSQIPGEPSSISQPIQGGHTSDPIDSQAGDGPEKLRIF